MIKHTEGEWIAMNRTGTGLYKIVSDTFQEVCETIMPYGNDLSRPKVFEQGEANAKLIAAAPDLLDACLECIEIIDRVPNACGLSENDINKKPHNQKLRAAIKKAQCQDKMLNNERMCGVGEKNRN